MGEPLTSRRAADLPVDGPWRSGGITVRCDQVADEALVERLWPVYEETFGELRIHAAARQVLTHDEFVTEIADQRVWKYVATDDTDGQVIGMMTLTDDLSTVPWVSPEFYAHRYPEHAARNAIFYLGFTLVHPTARSGRVFLAMARPVVTRIAARRGVCAYDICGFNDATIAFGANLERLLRRMAEVEAEQVDVQTYYATSFTGQVMM